MKAGEIIMKKRGIFVTNDAGEVERTGNITLNKDEISFMVKGYVDGSIPDYQMSAFLMAVFFNGMTFEETAFLTECMLHSGEVIDLSSLRKGEEPFVDKHSTGGVGDKISLPLAPIVASCGVKVPMMSGRALGHTGGTLDKLESIEGYNVNLSVEEFKKFIAENGYAMTGQTKKIVPADRLIYALRDVTATVESVNLITASVLSKKVAEGADSLVFDVKCGRGAFMKSLPDAERLAVSLVKTANAMGKTASALITAMDTPLGRKIGNFLEIEETLECLEGNAPKDVTELTYALASEMIVLGKKAATREEALEKVKEAVSSGRAKECFLKNVEMQGGNMKKLLSEVGKRRSPSNTVIKAKEDGFIFIDAYKCGLAGVGLGVGRLKTSDAVCADAGIVLEKVSGDKVKKGEVVMRVYGKDEECLKDAEVTLDKAVEYTATPYSSELILKTIR